MIQNRTSTEIQLELLLAIESARNRLAVAIASETKSTPPDRRQYYLETADRMRRISRKLRKDGAGIPQDRQPWIRALEALNRLPAQSKALPLCRILRDIAKRLGGSAE